jgi:RNA polymerase sigma-70 factor (ECF subfamily)
MPWHPVTGSDTSSLTGRLADESEGVGRGCARRRRNAMEPISGAHCPVYEMHVTARFGWSRPERTSPGLLASSEQFRPRGDQSESIRSAKKWRDRVMSEDTNDDEALMRQIAAGDERAFRLLADRHLSGMLRLAQKTLGSPADADDVAQDALLRIWRNAARWRADRSRLTTWIYTIVFRLCIDRIRGPRALPLEYASEVEDATPGAFEIMSRTGELRQLAVAMRLLQPRQRAALTLFYHEELSGEEAAVVLGISQRAFWSLLHRARKAIQQQMDASLDPPKAASP